MKPEDFEQVSTGRVTQYHHIETGKKREQLIKDRISGRITPSEFEAEQKKMRGGKYLKMIYSEAQYLEAITNEDNLK